MKEFALVLLAALAGHALSGVWSTGAAIIQSEIEWHDQMRRTMEMDRKTLKLQGLENDICLQFQLRDR